MPVSFGFAKGNTTKTKRKLVPSVIPTDGLQVYLDAGDPNSYPGAGDTWFDLSGNNRHSTISSLIKFNKNSGGGAFEFTTGWTGNVNTTSVINTSVPNLSSSSCTVIAASRYTNRTNSRLRIVNAESNNWLLGHWANSTEKHFAGGWVTNSTGNANDNDIMWRIYACTNNTSANTKTFFVNNTQIASSGSAFGPNGITLGRGGVVAGVQNEASLGEVGFLLVWNRVLTAAELTAVYDYFKNRFIVQDSSLKLHLDASRSDCYPGSGTTLNDLSPNVLNCTLSSGASWSNNAFVFSDTNDVILTNSNVDLRSDFTLECWASTDIATTFNLFGQGSTSTSNGLHCQVISNHPRGHLFAMYFNDVSKTTVGTTYPTNTWYHFAFTYSHSSPFTKKMYINGVDIGLTPEQTQLAYTQVASVLRIGSTMGSGDNSHDGKIAQARYYNKVLSASEVLQNYNATKTIFYPTEFPANVSGLQMWLKADSGALDANNAVISADNTAVATWMDLSGNTKSAKQSTAGSRPLYRTNVVNGLPAIQFDGSDDEMLLDNLATPGSNFSYFAVIKPTRVAAAGHSSRFMGSKISGSSGINFGCTTTQFSAVLRDNAGTGPDIHWGTSQAFSDTILSSVIMDSSNTKLRVNRNQVGTSTRTSWSGTGSAAEYIGSDGSTTVSRFGGYICEILVFNRALSGRELNQVEQYLAAKWGISKAASKDNEGLVAHWDAGNTSSYPGSGTTWSDLTGNGNHATFASEPAYISDNSGYINYQKSAARQGTVSTMTNLPTGNSSVTIEAWVKHGGVNEAGIVGWGTYQSVRQVHALRTLNTNQIRFYGWGDDLDVTPNLVENTWYHIVARYDANAGVKDVWVNGVFQGRLAGCGAHNVTASNFAIGKTFGSEHLQGGLASLKIYDRAISNDEITIKYNESKSRYVSFTPSNTNMSLWLDTSQSNTVSVDGSNGISQIKDKSGSGKNSTQSDSTKRPVYTANVLNGKSAAVYDGTNDCLVSSTVTLRPFTSVFFVTKTTTDKAFFIEHSANSNIDDGCFIYGTSAGMAVTGRANQPRPRIDTTPIAWLGSSDELVSVVTTPTPAVAGQIYRAWKSGSELTLTHSFPSTDHLGNPVGTGTMADISVTRDLHIGARGNGSVIPMQGNLYEILVYNTTLTTAQRQQIEGYLAWKWGLQSKLPSDHPYKSVAP